MATVTRAGRVLLKEKGAFYTPPAMARALVDWAVRTAHDSVLDPSCGDGEFLVQAIRRLRELGASQTQALDHVLGVDSDPNAARLAAERLETEGGSARCPRVTPADFFSCRPDSRAYASRLDPEVLPTVDVVVGNPPYIRYHGFQGPTRASAASAVAHAGIRLTDLTSSWAPFVVHATSFLKPSGRLAFVLPGELLSVDYAKSIRDFLGVAFKSVTITAFDERVFPGVLADTLFVLADKSGLSEGLALNRYRNLSDLPSDSSYLSAGERLQFSQSGRKWSDLVLDPEARSAYRRCSSFDGVGRLGDRFSVDIGIVSGNNDVFLLTQEQLERIGIPPTEVLPILSSSGHILGTHVSAREFDAIRASGQRCWLLNFAGKSNLSSEAKAYLASVPLKGGRERYKIRSRRKWYEVPSVYAPTAFMSYFISEAPRFALNEIGATSTNTIHRLRNLSAESDSPSAVLLSCYSSLTMLSSEVEGRSYGGGVGKLETKEAENLRVVIPTPDAAKELGARESEMHSALRCHNQSEAVRLVDEVLLLGQLGLSEALLRSLRSGLETLRSRRKSRMRGAS